MAQTSRVALITGVAPELAATARRFAAQGTAVALVGRRPEPLDETVSLIQNAGGEALAIPLTWATR
jgi:NAD(P)-dependent dehydrogenase (short-subunit alcohol dehydrogenase family)